MHDNFASLAGILLIARVLCPEPHRLDQWRPRVLCLSLPICMLQPEVRYGVLQQVVLRLLRKP